MQAEISAAEQSLHETEHGCSSTPRSFGMALELAGDIAGVYEAADEDIRRGYNQAFFRRIDVLPDWDDEGQAVSVTGAELTEPYAVLLADDLVEGVLTEAEALRVGAETSRRRPWRAVFCWVFVLRQTGGGGGIRTLGRRCRRQRFSRPSHSTALPPLRG